MKYLKKFETINKDKPKIGDYIIASINFSHSDINQYINNSVGKFKKLDGFILIVQYVCPNYIYDGIIEREGESEGEFEIKKGIRYINMSLKEHEVKYWSKDKEELEIKLRTKKYNL